MYPITSYLVTPNLLGIPRWQAEIDGQHSRFARRAYTRAAAERKIRDDENALHDGESTFMQMLWLPLTMPLRRFHDRLCQATERRRRERTRAGAKR